MQRRKGGQVRNGKVAESSANLQRHKLEKLSQIDKWKKTSWSEINCPIGMKYGKKWEIGANPNEYTKVKKWVRKKRNEIHNFFFRKQIIDAFQRKQNIFGKPTLVEENGKMETSGVMLDGLDSIDFGEGSRSWNTHRIIWKLVCDRNGKKWEKKKVSIGWKYSRTKVCECWWKKWVGWKLHVNRIGWSEKESKWRQRQGMRGCEQGRPEVSAEVIRVRARVKKGQTTVGHLEMINTLTQRLRRIANFCRVWPQIGVIVAASSVERRRGITAVENFGWMKCLSSLARAKVRLLLGWVRCGNGTQAAAICSGDIWLHTADQGRFDKCMDGWTNGRMDDQTDRQADKQKAGVRAAFLVVLKARTTFEAAFLWMAVDLLPPCYCSTSSLLLLNENSARLTMCLFLCLFHPSLLCADLLDLLLFFAWSFLRSADQTFKSILTHAQQFLKFKVSRTTRVHTWLIIFLRVFCSCCACCAPLQHNHQRQWKTAMAAMHLGVCSQILLWKLGETGGNLKN